MNHVSCLIDILLYLLLMKGIVSGSSGEYDYVPEALLATRHQKEQKKPMTESESRKRDIEEAEEDDIEDVEFKLPFPVKSIASRQDKTIQNLIPINAPDTKVQEQIKARFSIGAQPQSEPSVNTSSSTPIIKKKRRLTTIPSVFSSKPITPSSSTIVLTCMPTAKRIQCEEAIKKLKGKYQLGTE